uniref:Uncharacterized protein n=1 Tax=Solanum lycopersicum TaxID=4081 RepID=A0A3Q7HY38_SOLLC
MLVTGCRFGLTGTGNLCAELTTVLSFIIPTSLQTRSRIIRKSLTTMKVLRGIASTLLNAKVDPKPFRDPNLLSLYPNAKFSTLVWVPQFSHHPSQYVPKQKATPLEKPILDSQFQWVLKEIQELEG